MGQSKPLKILMVSALCPPDFDGGYELRAFQIAKALRRVGHDVTFVTSAFRSTYAGEQIDEPWVRRILHWVPLSTSKTVWRYVSRIPLRVQCTKIARINIVAMRKFLSNQSFDIAYCFGLERVSLATMMPAVEIGLPILWHAGDAYIADQTGDSTERFPGLRLALKVFARAEYKLEQRVSYDNMAFVSQFLKAQCERRGLRPVNGMVISRGFEGELGHAGPRLLGNEPPKFLMACRVERNKGVHIAVQAASLLNVRRPDLQWRLEVAGVARSGYVDGIKQKIDSAGISDRVELLGFRSHKEVLERMRAATAFMSCATYDEPFAGTIIEALALGTPLIGSNKGSILEVVEPNVSALVYEADDAEQLSRHMEAVLVEPEQAVQRAQNGLAVVRERYTLDAIIEQTEEAFSEVIHRSASRSEQAAST